MAGAIIAIDQDRPGPTTSFGTPGVARNDLWQSRTIRPRSTAGPNISQVWTLLDKPAGSTTVLNNSTATTCDFTPDIPGTYRIQLVTNGGGTGNIQILVARVRYDVNGALANRGWVLPAFGELPPEANYGGNTRGWDEPWDFLVADLLAFLLSFNPTLAGDVIGAMASNEVVALRNLPINTTAPTPGQYLGWDGTKLTYSTVVSFTAGHDLSGTSSSQTVIGWLGIQLDSATFTSPANNTVPVFDNVSGKWKAAAGSSLFTPGGDLSGTSASQNVIGWASHPLDSTSFGAPADAGIPIWNSSGHWFVHALTGDITLSDLGAVVVTQFQSRPFAATAPGTGSFIGWNGSTWQPTNSVASLKITSLTSGVLGVDASNNVVLETSLPLPTELAFVSGVFNTSNSTPTRIGSRLVSLTAFPTTLADGRTLHAAIVFDFETTAGTASIQLQNITDNETVTGTLQTTTSLASTEVSVSLTVGSAAGNLKTGKLYEVQLFLTGGSSLDRATCTNARLVLSYS